MTDTPKRLNIGSGKLFKHDYLNVDCDPFWRPDVVADLNKPFPPHNIAQTARFGEIRIEPGTFEEIEARDVLEHIPNLITCMGSCLSLLAPGGSMHIIVPYDLSHGAWQDPTHVRAFNERSWTYYTEWYWYLGWQEARFELTRLEFVRSELGQRLAGEGMDEELILRTPRAVDAMEVTLEKVLLSDKEKAYVQKYLKNQLDPPAECFPGNPACECE